MPLKLTSLLGSFNNPVGEGVDSFLQGFEQREECRVDEDGSCQGDAETCLQVSLELLK